MTKRFKTILMTLFVIFLLLMAGKYLLDFLFADMCGNDIKQKTPSPSGENVAYIFERSCGATTGFSPQLSILNKDDDFQNESGNTFRSDKDFSIEWFNENALKVIYDKSSETYEIDKKVNGIKIEYVGE
ncbi:hypothetical protein [Peribacillus frigoritolerans]|uniref:hypothetical protein n=1 Tax=Peribacillus castrilensis TaxID=2897690 RepID=UPI00296E54E5|nr:DUF5412 domain-containing protein [Peribacillus castrilensis]